jgi:3-oxoadipate enol-lactonase
VAGEFFVAAGGNTLHALIEGSGGRPWLTCLHTLATNLHLWDGLASTLAAEFRLLRIDARGHGESTAVHPASSFAELSDDVVAVWDALGIERSHILGLSMGGITGLALALDYPERLERLIAAGCRADAPDFFRKMWPERRRLLREGGFPAIADATLPNWFTEETRRDRPHLPALARDMILGTSPAGYVGASWALEGLDLKPRLGAIRSPTLALAGAQDGQYPAALREIAMAIPQARYAEIPDAAHLSCLEAPERFAEIVLDFLR